MVRGQQNKKDSGKFIYQNVRFEVEQAQIEPPPPGFTSKFKTLEDWLLNICQKGNPEKQIVKYKFGLLESATYCILFLVGVNTYHVGNNHSLENIEFEPKNMFFKLSESDYEHLNRSQLLDRLTSQLKKFVNTEDFKSSFLAKANIVVFETNGETIWSKQ